MILNSLLNYLLLVFIVYKNIEIKTCILNIYGIAYLKYAFTGDAKQTNKSSTAFQVGIIAAALTCAFGLSFLNSAGAVIALGTALYIGAKALKTIIVKEVSDKEKDE